MKRFFTHNWKLKLLAVLLSAVTWLIVITVTDPTQKKTFEIPVELVNEDIITARGQSYELEGEDTVTISVETKRSILSTLKSSDFKAEADFSSMYQNTQVPVKVTSLNSKVPASAVEQQDLSIRVKIEDIISVTKAIEYSLIGQPANGYAVGDVDIAPASVTVTGPESFIQLVKQAVVRIDVTGANESFDGTGNLLLFDGNDVQLDVTALDAADWNTDGVVEYSVSLLSVQTIPVTANIQDTDKVASGFKFTGVSVEPDKLSLSGLKADMAKITEICISDISASGLSETTKKTVDIRSYLPEGVEVYAGDTEVTVTVSIEELKSKVLSVSAGIITVNDVPESYEYMIIDDEVEVTVRGLEEDLEKLTGFDGQMAISLKGLSAGTHQVPVQVTASSDAYEQSGTVYVTVEITDPNAAEAESSAENFPEDEE